MTRILTLATISVITTITANLLLKKGAVNLNLTNLSPAQMPKLLLHMITSSWIIAGLSVLSVGFFTWILLLNKAKLQLLYPTVVSLQIILIIVLSWVFFKESVSLVQGLGIIIIVIGIFLVIQQ